MIPAEGLPEGLRSRVLAAAARSPATRPHAWTRRMTFVGFSVATWLVAAVVVSGVRGDWSELPALPLVATLAALVLVASLAWTVGLSRGRAMVGAATESLSVALWGLLLALHALVIVLDPRGPSTETFAGVWSTIRHAAPCFLRTIVVAVPLLALVLLPLRGLTLARPFLVGACTGLGAATLAHAVAWLHCPIGGPAHALPGHLLPAIPMILLGGYITRAAERRWSGYRRATGRDPGARLG